MRGFPHRSTPSARWARSWRPIMTKPRSIVERYFAAFCAGDVDAAMACVHPDAIWHVDGDPVVGTVGVIKGCDAVRAWQRRFSDSFRPLDFSVEQLIAGDRKSTRLNSSH